jgi:type VI secretion system lysozyme-like protein
MREPRNMEGALAPLFDRLSTGRGGLINGSGGNGGRDQGRIIDRRALRASVLEEISRLLNTRSSPVAAIAESARGSVLDYGLPETTSLTAVSEADQRTLADSIAKRMAAFEPRLSDVRVTIGPMGENARGVSAVMTAMLRIGSVYEPVTFPLTISRDTQRIGHTPGMTADSIAG